MARVIQKQDDLVWYVPDVGDNREDPEPLAVQLSLMSVEDWRAVERGMGLPGRKVNFIARAHKVQERVLAERVKAVKNYRVDDRDITTGAELYQYGEKAVIEDVYRALEDRSVLGEGALGKFD